MSSPASALELAAAGAVDLVAAGSLEMGAHRPQDARAIAALLPAGVSSPATRMWMPPATM